MSITDDLKKVAEEIALKARSRVADLEAQELHLMSQIHEVQAVSQKLRGAVQRLAKFQVQTGGQYQCPRCWIDDEVCSNLRPIPSDTKADLFRCGVCHLELSI